MKSSKENSTISTKRLVFVGSLFGQLESSPSNDAKETINEELEVAHNPSALSLPIILSKFILRKIKIDKQQIRKAIASKVDMELLIDNIINDTPRFFKYDRQEMKADISKILHILT